MGVDPRNDPDFMKASPADQMAYLRATDKDFAAASPADQQSYLSHLREPSAASPIAPPAIQKPSGVNVQNYGLQDVPVVNRFLKDQPTASDHDVLDTLKQMAINTGESVGQV